MPNVESVPQCKKDSYKAQLSTVWVSLPKPTPTLI